jgi:hypothetical protein
MSIGLLGSACSATDSDAFEDDGFSDVADTPARVAETGEESETPNDEILGTASQALVFMPKRGGDGGTPGGFLQSGDLGSAIVRSGNLVDQLTIVSPFGVFGPFGGTGGSPQFIDAASSERFVGIYGRAGTYVDQLGFIVSNRADNLPTRLTRAAGGGGGNFFFDACPDGTRLVGLNVRSATLLDAIQAVCN